MTTSLASPADNLYLQLQFQKDIYEFTTKLSDENFLKFFVGCKIAIKDVFLITPERRYYKNGTERVVLEKPQNFGHPDTWYVGFGGLVRDSSTLETRNIFTVGYGNTPSSITLKNDDGALGFNAGSNHSVENNAGEESGYGWEYTTDILIKLNSRLTAFGGGNGGTLSFFKMIPDTTIPETILPDYSGPVNAYSFNASLLPASSGFLTSIYTRASPSTDLQYVEPGAGHQGTDWYTTVNTFASNVSIEFVQLSPQFTENFLLKFPRWAMECCMQNPFMLPNMRTLLCKPTNLLDEVNVPTTNCDTFMKETWCTKANIDTEEKRFQCACISPIEDTLVKSVNDALEAAGKPQPRRCVDPECASSGAYKLIQQRPGGLNPECTSICLQIQQIINDAQYNVASISGNQTMICGGGDKEPTKLHIPQQCGAVACIWPQQCSGGKCVDPCNNGTCQAGFKCTGGFCVPIPTTPCVDGVCPTGFDCVNKVCLAHDPNRELCPTGTCTGGKTCVLGICVATDPCRNITCTAPQKCSGGKCVNCTQDTDCNSNGVCTNGLCVCNEGFSGLNCETKGGISTGILVLIIVGSILVAAGIGVGVYFGTKKKS